MRLWPQANPRRCPRGGQRPFIQRKSYCLDATGPQILRGPRQPSAEPGFHPRPPRCADHAATVPGARRRRNSRARHKRAAVARRNVSRQRGGAPPLGPRIGHHRRGPLRRRRLQPRPIEFHRPGFLLYGSPASRAWKSRNTRWFTGETVSPSTGDCRRNATSRAIRSRGSARSRPYSRAQTKSLVAAISR